MIADNIVNDPTTIFRHHFRVCVVFSLSSLKIRKRTTASHDRRQFGLSQRFLAPDRQNPTITNRIIIQPANIARQRKIAFRVSAC